MRTQPQKQIEMKLASPGNAAMASAALVLSCGSAFAQMGGGQGGGMAGGGSGWGMNSGWLFGIVILALVVVAIAVMMNRK